MTPQPSHRAAARHRVVLIAAAVVTLAAAGSVPAALAAQRGPAPTPRKAADANLALGKPVTGSAACRPDEGAAKAVNGTVSGLRDKWCSAAAEKTLRVDLGSPTALTSITVRHAAAGGERAALNTRDFDVQVSADGTAFTTVAAVRGNTAGVTSHATTAKARYVRLTVTRAEQAANGGVARIYELEVYGAPAVPDPQPTATPSPSVPPAPSPSPTGAPKPDPVPPPSASCFPYPERNPAQGPNPVIVYAPGVEPLDQKHLDAARAMWVTEWPGAWQRFAIPESLNDPWETLSKVVVNNDTSATFGDGKLEIPRRDIVGGVDKQDFGSWMHETAHGVQMHYPEGTTVPALYAEGIPDFIRFVAHKEDPMWKLVNLSDVDSEYFVEQRGWDGGYRLSARFLLWVTQHYDKSGAKYQFVHDLNLGASTAKPDWQGMFTKFTGKTYHELFTEYAKDKVINPHC